MEVSRRQDSVYFILKVKDSNEWLYNRIRTTSNRDLADIYDTREEAIKKIAQLHIAHNQTVSISSKYEIETKYVRTVYSTQAENVDLQVHGVVSKLLLAGHKQKEVSYPESPLYPNTWRTGPPKKKKRRIGRA